MQDVYTEPETFKARMLDVENGNGEETHGKGRRALRMLTRIAGAAAIGTLAYAFVVRPWHLRWGATEEEAAATLPGDEILPHTQLQSTRAITIDAPVADVWPWLVQMGQGRGGLYSYDWLENLVGCDIHSVDRIVPELQRLQVGDTFRLGPEGYPFFTVASIVPERELVLAARAEMQEAEAGEEPADTAVEMPSRIPGLMPGATWAFVLHPVDEGKTRLLVRLRGDWESSPAMTLFNRALLEPAHFVMERKMIYGIKEKAEKGKGY